MIISVSRYAVIYIWAIISNLHNAYMDATFTKEEYKNSMIKVGGMEVLSKAIYDERQFWKKINDKLKKNNFRPVSFCGYEEWPMKMVDESTSD
jgi:hypothetical protein